MSSVRVLTNLVPRIYSAFKMAAGRGEDPSLYWYNTHADWQEDMDILTLVMIGQNRLPCEMAGLWSCILIFFCNWNEVIASKIFPVLF